LEIVEDWKNSDGSFPPEFLVLNLVHEKNLLENFVNFSRDFLNFEKFHNDVK
jgi:hypothetical protein